MSPLGLAAVMAAGLLGMAVFAPWLFQRAAPALVRFPRVAMTVLLGSIVAWLGTLLAFGPALAWAVSGPDVLPEPAAAACQRCLDAANPFSTGTIETAVPVVLLLAVPLAASAAIAAGFTAELVRRARQSRQIAQRTLAGASRRTISGHKVFIVDDGPAFAMTFPTRNGGVVVSSGALAVLDADELAAVLEHEHAHLRQRHHVIALAVASLARYLRWVPLIAAVKDALPHYLEIAADNRARLRVGTPALVGALIKLGERTVPAGEDRASVLHAAGPERIRQLVHPCTGGAGALAAVAVAFYLALLGVAAAAVHVPYAAAALTGCL